MEHRLQYSWNLWLICKWKDYSFQTKDDAEWIEQNIFTTDSSGYDWVNASDALSDLDTWLNDNEYLLPNFDQATSLHQVLSTTGITLRLKSIRSISISHVLFMSIWPTNLQYQHSKFWKFPGIN